MKKASVLDGLSFYFLALQKTRLPSAEVNVCWRKVLKAIVVSPVAIIVDEVIDLVFEIARKEVVFREGAVLEALVPALDLSLCLWMARRTAFARFSVYQATWRGLWQRSWDRYRVAAMVCAALAPEQSLRRPRLGSAYQ